MKYCWCIFLLCCLAACQSDTSSNNDNDIKLFADFYIRFLENEQQLKAEADFKKGLERTTAAKVDFDGRVLVNQKLLTPFKLQDRILRYQYQNQSSLKPSYTFTLQHDDDRVHEQRISIEPIGKFSLEQGIASKTSGFTLRWDGKDLGANERLLVLITDQNNKAHSVNIAGPTKGQRAKVPAQSLAPLTTGNGYIYLVKKQEKETIHDEVVLSSLAEYYTDRILIEIVE